MTNLLFAGYDRPELNYKLQLRRIHATTFGNYETREKVNNEGKINKHAILSKSKNGKRQQQQQQRPQASSYFSEMKFKDSLGRCHSLPLNLFKTTHNNYVTLSHLENVSVALYNNGDETSSPEHLKQEFDSSAIIHSMSASCNSNNETYNTVSRSNSAKYNKLDILLSRNSIERNTIMNNIMSAPSEHITSKKGRGYFYESVGGVYYSFGNSISEDKSYEDNKEEECGIENTLCDQTENGDNRKNVECDSSSAIGIDKNDNAKWKDRNLNTLSESLDKGEGDSGRQTCSSPISSEDNSNNDKHIYAIARCAANVASLTGILFYVICQ